MQQVATYLNEWSSFVDNSCGEIDTLVGAALEKYGKEMDALSQAIQSNLQRFDAAEREATALAATLSADVDTLLADVEALDAEQTKELQDRTASMRSAAKRTLSEVKKKAHAQR